MKYSGIKWIGEIPDNWNVRKVKQCFYISKEQAHEENPIILSLARAGVKVRDISNNEGQLAASYDNYNPVMPGDLLLNPMDLYSGANCSLSEVSGVISPAYINLRKKVELNPKFYDYYFKTQYWAMAMFAHGKGVSFDNRWTMNAETLLNYYLPFTSSDVQDKIVDLINKKTAEIDSLIEIENQQIEKLKEYKQAVITEAVTKGLDKNLAMKDSGIEWIGKIPEGWNTIKIKFTSWLKGRIGWDGLKSGEFIEEGPYLITGTDFIDGGINWDTCVHISEERFMEDELLHIYENDLLITKDGTIGKLAIVKDCPEKVSLNSGVMIIRNTTKWKYLDKYLYYILSSEYFYLWYGLSQSGNSTIKHLYQGQFYNFEFTYPDLNEQKKISDYLDEKCADIDKLIEIKKQKIDQLDEYKKSLIYEYVTGKKEVC